MYRISWRTCGLEFKIFLIEGGNSIVVFLLLIYLKFVLFLDCAIGEMYLKPILGYCFSLIVQFDFFKSSVIFVLLYFLTVLSVFLLMSLQFVFLFPFLI